MNKANIEYAYGIQNRYTFRCKSIKKWVEKHYKPGVWCDPFFGDSPFNVEYKNDLSYTGTDSHEWIKGIESSSMDGVFFDPPYSLEQIKRAYNNMGIDSWQSKYRNQSGNFPMIKDEIIRILKPGGVCLSFGWSSVGMGSGRGMIKKDILLVCHSGASYDTICTMETKGDEV